MFKRVGSHVRTLILSKWTILEVYEIVTVAARHCRQLETLIIRYVRISKRITRREFIFGRTLSNLLIIRMFSELKKFDLVVFGWVGALYLFRQKFNRRRPCDNYLLGK